MKLDKSVCTHAYEHATGRDKGGREYTYCNTCGSELSFEKIQEYCQMPTYQTRPVKPKVVEAIKWTGDNNESVAAFLNWSAPVVPSDDESFWYGELHVRLNDWIVIDTVLPMKFRRCTLIDDDAFIARYEPKEEKA